ncbi:hypothetical protein HYW99_00600 [Candidatus Woesearchaeota archaeon]|nr:hypothetical protein [Candidatus Woesearchaeota archaeon]
MALVESFSGIRGIYNKDLTDSIAIKYAWSYYSFLKNKTKKNKVSIVIGTDTRPSGQKLCNAILGILDSDFIDVGMVPTPAIEFAVRHFNADGGIIITASHNEPYWNGFKFLRSDGTTLNENEIKTVISNSKRLINFHKIQEKKILERNEEVINSYCHFIYDTMGRENITKIISSKQKIIIDPNGGTAIIVKNFLDDIGVDTIGINMNYGEFNRIIEPTEDALIYLKNIIDDNKADFAAGFDCDADRIEIMLKNGNLLSGDYILALIVKEVLSNTNEPKNKFVVVNDATSSVVRSVVQQYGAKIIEVEVGEANVIAQMDRVKAIVGGEGSSGGVIVPPSRCRDGILTLLMILALIAKRQKSLEEISQELPKYYTLKRKIEFESKRFKQIKNFIKSYYSDKGFNVIENGGIQGSLKIITNEKSFVWFRASKTEANVFRIMSDSNKKEEAEDLIGEAINVFDKANEQ